MTAYYNENDPFNVGWLKELMKAGLIADGHVDDRSIEDVKPAELLGYDQHHFFTGIGVWPFALRNAGWPDSRPVWTGSCPCQPFSTAGKGKGLDDERHLWPAWFHLIRYAKRPGIPVFGEQVDSKGAKAWLDIVHADLEAIDHTLWPVILPSAGFGAPIIRHRHFFVAQGVGGAEFPGLEGLAGHVDDRNKPGREREEPVRPTPEAGCSGGMAGADSARSQPGRETAETARHGDTVDSNGGAVRMASTRGQRRQETPTDRHEATGRDKATEKDTGFCGDNLPGPTNGYWKDVDWLGCRDGKFRPVRPGTSPLANGVINRVGKLRGYGNAINAEVAKGFIEDYMETEKQNMIDML